MSRSRTQLETRRGVAPLELIMVLPIMWLLFICVLYVGWSAMIAFQNESICRNAAWKQRTEPGSDVRPFVFGDATAGRIEKERTEPIKTGLILDRWKQTAKAKHVIIAHTWDFKDVPLDKSQMYRQDPVPNLLALDNVLKTIKDLPQTIIAEIQKEFGKLAQDAIERFLKPHGFDRANIEKKVAQKKNEQETRKDNINKEVDLNKAMQHETKKKQEATNHKSKLDAIPDRGDIDLAALADQRMDEVTRLIEIHKKHIEKVFSGLKFLGANKIRESLQDKVGEPERYFEIAFSKEINAHEAKLRKLNEEFDDNLAKLREKNPEMSDEEILGKSVDEARKEFMEEKKKEETREERTNRLVSENLKTMREYWLAKNEAENARKMIESVEATQDYNPTFNTSNYYD